jgi:hypothetical protein
MKSLKIFVFAALLMAATAGCTGKLNGVIKRDAQRVDILYTDSRLANAELVAIMPDGERFSGKSERLGKNEAMAEAFGTDDAEDSTHFKEVLAFSGNAQATLSGNRGNVIKCRFRITDILMGFSSGGVGLCQISDGRTIEVFF